LTKEEAEDDSLVLRYAYESRRTGVKNKEDDWMTIIQRRSPGVSVDGWGLFNDTKEFA